MGNANSVNDVNDEDTPGTTRARVRRTRAKVMHANKILLRESSTYLSSSNNSDPNDPSSPHDSPSSSLWGNVFTQGEGAEKWSYHFVSRDGEGEDGAFLSHKHANVKLDDGSDFPDRVPFLTHGFDEGTNTFRGVIHYPQTCNSTAWGGYDTEEVEMKFDTEFMVILSGKVVWRDKNGEELAQNFGMCHIYVNANITDRVIYSHQYTELTARLKQEGATTRTITLVARVFLEHVPQGKTSIFNHSARHQAILDIVREHTPNPTPTYNPGAPWGNTFLRKSGVSLHILSNSAYISYEQRECGTRKLDDRSPAPSRVPFVSHEYDEEGRVFRGSIDFVASYCSTWGGVVKCEYEMTFDSMFMVILEGNVVKEKEDGEKVTLNYGEKGVYYVNEALTFKIVDVGKYDELIERLKEEGASVEIISNIQHVFREDSRANIFVRHKAILDIVKRDWVELRYLDHVWKNDKEIALAALAQNGHALYYASDNLKNDRDFILAAVLISGSALIYTSDALKANEEVVRAAVDNDGSSLKFVSAKLQDHHDIVLAAVSNDGSALEFASKGLKDDRDVVLAAVSNHGTALEHASKALRDDREVVLKAVEDDVGALLFASDGQKDDEGVVTAAVTTDGSCLQHVSKRFRGRKDTVLLAVKSNSTSLRFAMAGLIQDRDCLVSSGLLNFKDYSDDTTTKRIVISAPVDTHGKITSHAVLFSLLLQIHPYFQDFIMHFPNAWESDEDSFRSQLGRGMETKGIMVQIREFDHSPSVRGHILGDGQKAESDMAKEVGIKVFNIYQGRTLNKRWAKDFEEKHIDALVDSVESWYEDGGVDMNEIDIKL